MKLKYFESEAELEKILEDYKDIFESIESYGQQLLQGQMSTAEDFSLLLNFATGAYTSLEPIYSIAQATKLNEELKQYVEKKRDLENTGEKVVASHLEKESSLAVANYRRIRAILEGYVLASEKMIITCQTQLKRLQKDEKYKPVEE